MNEHIVSVELQKEMRTSFIDYAMSVIVSRAIPDVRDGLKPVHRRIVYGMWELSLTPDARFRKAANAVGYIMGDYHPHGDSAIYDALVRLAQPASSRYPIVNGHGNFGDLDNPPAAMRYTECKLAPLAMEMLADIDKETVDTRPNFDDRKREPVVLPSQVPTLLLNGSAGIAVGMATNIPPHNLSEVCDGVIAKIDNPELDAARLMQYIKGPDFPGGGIIMGREEILKAYETGRGSIPVRGVATIDTIPSGSGRQSRTAIIVTSLPYLVGPEAFSKRVAELVKDEKLVGIADVNDETDRNGLRVVIELKRDANAQIVLNNLYKQTQLQQSFSVNTLALVPLRQDKSQQLTIPARADGGSERRSGPIGLPAVLGLPAILDEFIKHREEVVERRTRYMMRKDEEKAHVLLGLLKALGNIDQVIKIIRGAESTAEARTELMKKFELSEIQANAILDMALKKLTRLESGSIQADYDQLMKNIAEYKEILADRQKVLNIIKAELTKIKEKYGDARRTEIAAVAEENFRLIDLIPNERMVIFITQDGYIKRTPLDSFRRQKRNTRGVSGVKTKDEDNLRHMLVASSHDKLLMFTNRGVVFSVDVTDIPEAQRSARGLAMVNLISMNQDDNVTAVLPVAIKDFELENACFVMLTKQGCIKKVAISDFESINRSGKIAITLTEENGTMDELAWVRRSNGNSNIILGTADGMCIRYLESEVRPMGRQARGVNAIDLYSGDEIVGFDVFEPTPDVSILIVTTDGYGKRVDINDFRDQKRGGKGIIGIKFKNDSSRVASLRIVYPTNEVIIATHKGIVVRQQTDNISMQGRMATGVRLQQLEEDDQVVSVTPLLADAVEGDEPPAAAPATEGE